jgi:hypothetical protein
MNDTTAVRMEMLQDINADPGSREALEIKHGQIWDTSELSKDFDVTSFLAPFVGVTEKSTGTKGLLMFQHQPRFYFDFQAV